MFCRFIPILISKTILKFWFFVIYSIPHRTFKTSNLTKASKGIEKKQTLSGFVNTRPSEDYYHDGTVCDLYVHPQGDYEVVSIYWRENRASGLTGENFVSKVGVAKSFSLRGLNMTLTDYLKGIKTGALVGRNKEGLPVTAIFEFELLGE